MNVRAIVGVGLVLAGAGLDVQIALALGVVTVGFEIVRRPWLRRGLDGIGYRRHLSSERIPWGEDVGLTLEAWNERRLPISWLRTDDAIDQDLVVRERRLLPGELGDLTLRNTWTLGPRELVRRRLRLGASHRGIFRIGPTELAAGDLFALHAGHDSRAPTDVVIAWPRTVPAPAIARRERWGGTDRATRGLSEDPSRFVGVRPYQLGDPVRRLHVRTSARIGSPMSKRFEPSRDRDVLLVVDLELPDPADTRDAAADADAPDAPAGGSAPRPVSPAERVDPTEDLIVVAASLIHSLALGHAAFGLAAAGYAGPRRRIAYLPVASGHGQLERGLDLLARLSGEPSASFDRLAAHVGRVARGGTTVLVLTRRNVGPMIRPLRLLQRQGATVGILATGALGSSVAASARAAGLDTQVVQLDDDWRTATNVSLAG